MVLGYRRSDETESAREENSQPLHHSVSSLARARRRVGDGFLPPLKSVGLPPIKHIVFPTVPDTEDAEPPTDDPQVDDHVSLAGVPVDEKAKSVQSGVTCDDNGVLDVESEEEEQNEEEEVNMQVVVFPGSLVTWERRSRLPLKVIRLCPRSPLKVLKIERLRKLKVNIHLKRMLT
ncbi:hypothetical protein OTU49_002157 [Cherax quadricarinatus]|uniref:Uncharacterized protein n=1 Tax=Cherax quadricarinatus TaxID=27406 RepID=A0AAW0XR55_CHEQU